MKDFLHREFALDQQVVWPCRSGADLWMNTGVITGVLPDALVVNKQTRTGPRRVILQVLKNVVIVEVAA